MAHDVDVSVTGSVTGPVEPDHRTLIERATCIAANARDRADETEAARTIPPETIDELWAAELLRLRQPRRFGGLGRSALELYEVGYTLAQGCGSTGWVYTVVAGHANTITSFPPEAQAEVWDADPTALATSSLAPNGRATPTPGGYRLSGRFPFASGSDFARWAMLGAIASGPDGRVGPHIFLVPTSELAVIDDWHTLGLAGTGGKSLAADQILVPDHRVVPLPPLNGGVEPFSVQAPMLGAALGGLEAFLAAARTRAGAMGGPPPAESELYQALAGESWGDLRAAWLILTDAVRRTEAIGDEPVPEPMRRDNRAAGAVITKLATTAIERVFELGGGHAVYNSPLSRAVRDVRAAGQHMVANTRLASRDAGASLLRPRAERAG